jgi:hypothetical protein
MPGERLSLEEREEMALGVASTRSRTGMAREVGCPVSTVAREVARTVVVALTGLSLRSVRHAVGRAAPSRVVLRLIGREVERRLRLRHSPQQIENRLREAHPDEPHWWVFSGDELPGALPAGPWLPEGGADRCATRRAARRRRKGPNPAGAPAAGSGTSCRSLSVRTSC